MAARESLALASPGSAVSTLSKMVSQAQAEIGHNIPFAVQYVDPVIHMVYLV